ncbi:MAG: hypothetical protein FD189_1475 [Elusimicrobia bacterium]|nr:MAG: hypothetical protein FD154_1363 [Elusimicrobiota bacterium]KAF0155241.1 MAG: hypothetical protein FD189_1475 [Elusimicrobiota bacterium]
MNRPALLLAALLPFVAQGCARTPDSQYRNSLRKVKAALEADTAAGRFRESLSADMRLKTARDRLDATLISYPSNPFADDAYLVRALLRDPDSSSPETWRDFIRKHPNAEFEPWSEENLQGVFADSVLKAPKGPVFEARFRLISALVSRKACSAALAEARSSMSLYSSAGKPGSVEAMLSLGYLRAGSCFSKAGDRKAAEAAYREAADFFDEPRLRASFERELAKR